MQFNGFLEIIYFHKIRFEKNFSLLELRQLLYRVTLLTIPVPFPVA